MKKVLSFILSVVMIFTTFFCVSFPVGALTGTEEYQLYLADYLCENPHALNFINKEYVLPYRAFVERRNSSAVYQGLLASWQIATFKLSDATDYSTKKVGYYETILFDIISGEQNSSSALEDIDNIITSCEASSLKTLYSMYGKTAKLAFKDMDTSSAEYKEMMKTISGIEAFSDAFDYINKFGDVVGYCSDVYDYVSKCSKLQAVVQRTSAIRDVLVSIAERTDDLALKTACLNVSQMYADSVGAVVVQDIFVVGKAADLVADELLNNLWTDIVAECTSYGLAIKAGQVMGKLYANLLFSTEEDIEHYFSMRSLYDFENILIELIKSYQNSYKSSRTVANAKKVNESFKLLLKTFLEGAEYSKRYFEINYDKGLINQLIKNFKQEEYDIYMSCISQYKSMCEDYMLFINTQIYNEFFSVFESDEDKDLIADIKNISGVSSKDVIILEEDFESATDTFKYVKNRYYGLDLSKATVLNSDLETYSDIILSADLDLNGHTLTIHGDLRQVKGCLLINNGTLNVDGDYEIREISSVDGVTGEVKYTSSYGVLRMVNPDDVVNVGGDFVTYSYYDSSTSNEAMNCFYDGTLTISGDFYQYKSHSYNYYPENFQSTNSHKVVFSGDKVHKIYFESSDSYFTNLKAINNAKIEFTNPICGFTLSENMVFESDTIIETGTLDLNGHTLTIRGDLKLVGDINLNNGTLNINGNLRQNNGKLLVNHGTLNVDRDYEIREISSVDAVTGEITYSVSYGVLRMVNSDDNVNIGGDFVTYSYYGCSTSNEAINCFYDGILTISGDFYQYQYKTYNYNPENFQATNSHKVVFVGDKIHKIYFESANSYFSNLKTKDNGKIKFTSTIYGSTLCEDLTIDGDVVITTGELDLNGYTLTINGDLTTDVNVNLNNGTLNVHGDFRQTKGVLLVNHGTLNVDGDYEIRKLSNIDAVSGEITYSVSNGVLRMVNADDIVNVGGDFVTYSYYDCLTSNEACNCFCDGILTISGDFYQYQYKNSSNNHYPENFQATNNHKVIFTGDKIHKIYFESTECYFENLETLNNAKIEFVNPVCGFTLSEDMAFENDTTISTGTLDLNGHTLTINGNLNIAGEVDLNNGILNVRGKLTQTGGQLLVNHGTLNVGENYEIRKISSVNEVTGEIIYSASDGILRMVNADDKVNVKGDFITYSRKNCSTTEGYNCFYDGTLTVSGGFYQYRHNDYPKNFQAENKHTVIFTGNNAHKIYFQSSDSYFSNLRKTDNGRIEFASPVCGFTLCEDLIIDSDLVVSSGTLDLNGCTLTIRGTLRQTNGQVLINHGTLNIDGNYEIANINGDASSGNVTYSGTYATLRMVNSDDVINVSGDFITHSYYPCSTSTQSYNSFCDGILTISGNFYQNRNSYSDNFAATDNHTVVFSGDKIHEIYFEDCDTSYFSNLRIKDAAKIKFLSPVCGFVLSEDLSFEGNTKINYGTLDLNGYALTINGDLELGANVNLNNGVLNVKGNLMQTDGRLFVNQGELNVDKNYEIRKISSVNEVTGEITYSSSNGVLRMVKSDDNVNVGGDFITYSNRGCSTSNEAMNCFYDGTLTISGDFYQEAYNYSDNFAAINKHTVVFTGDRVHSIYFEKPNSSVFSCLRTSYGAKIQLTSSISGLTLCEDLTIEGDVILSYGVLDLNSHTLTIHGTLRQTGGTILINHGSLNVAQNYEIANVTVDEVTDKITYSQSDGVLRMVNSDDEISVEADFITYSKLGSLTSNQAYNCFYDGVLTISGSFYQYCGSQSGNFAATDNHTVIFNGIGKKNIYFQSNQSCFNKLKLAQHISYYELSRDNCWSEIEYPDCVHRLDDGVVTQEPTCEGNGVLTYTCEQCGEELLEPISANGHDYSEEWTIDVVPTYTSCGSKSHHCLVCGAKTDITSILPLELNKDGFYFTKTSAGFCKITGYGKNTTTMIIPDEIDDLKVDLIYQGAFKNNTNITKVTISNGVREIENLAFYSCSNLKEVIIPSSVTTIAAKAFYSCDNVTIKCIKGSAAYAYAVNNSIKFELIDITPDFGTYVDYENKYIFTNDYFNINSIDFLFMDTVNFEAVPLSSQRVGDTDYFGTGSQLFMFGEDETNEYTLVVKGDLNGDSTCDVLDAAAAHLYAVGLDEPTQNEIYAANGCISDELDVNSYQNVVNMCLAS